MRIKIGFINKQRMMLFICSLFVIKDTSSVARTTPISLRRRPVVTMPARTIPKKTVSAVQSFLGLANAVNYLKKNEQTLENQAAFILLKKDNVTIDPVFREKYSRLIWTPFIFQEEWRSSVEIAQEVAEFTASTLRISTIIKTVMNANMFMSIAALSGLVSGGFLPPALSMAGMMLPAATIAYNSVFRKQSLRQKQKLTNASQSGANENYNIIQSILPAEQLSSVANGEKKEITINNPDPKAISKFLTGRIALQVLNIYENFIRMPLNNPDGKLLKKAFFKLNDYLADQTRIGDFKKIPKEPEEILKDFIVGNSLTILNLESALKTEDELLVNLYVSKLALSFAINLWLYAEDFYEIKEKTLLQISKQNVDKTIILLATSLLQCAQFNRTMQQGKWPIPFILISRRGTGAIGKYGKEGIKFLWSKIAEILKVEPSKEKDLSKKIMGALFDFLSAKTESNNGKNIVKIDLNLLESLNREFNKNYQKYFQKVKEHQEALINQINRQL